MSLRHPSIFVKLALVALVAVLGVVALAYGRLSSVRPTELQARETKTRNLVEAAVSIVDGYHKLETSGQLSREQAQQAARTTLSGMRYDTSEYFWINDMQPRMIMHPAKPELNGTDLSANADPTGKRIFVDMVKVVHAHGAGFVAYQWPKAGHQKSVPKLSYVMGFQPWGWVIGSGIYIDDVDASVAAKRRTILWQISLILGLLLTVSSGIGLTITRPLRRLAAAITRIAGGSVGVVVPRGGRDELGRIADAVRGLQESLTAKAALEDQHRSLQEQATADHRRTVQDLTGRVDDTVRGVHGGITQAVNTMQQAVAALDVTTGHLSGSIQSVAVQIGESTTTATQATALAEEVAATVNGLTAAAETVGGASNLIRTIAEQTNLLALNATIEAARAGDLGKGFGVVAGEVKELAQQSTTATDKISAEIQAIQDTSQTTAQAMARMAQTVTSLSSAAHDMATSITGDGGTSDNSVQAVAVQTRAVAAQIQHACDDLTRQADLLQTEFTTLIAGITAEVSDAAP